jgi:hypothetical protein
MSTRVLQAARSVVLAVALAALVGTTSGQVKPGVKALTLTPMDYIEIRQLVNRYAFALDTGSNNGYDYADLFAPDGEFMRPKGREQLAAFARGPRLGPDNTVHYIMNHVIEPTPDGAIGKAYLIEFNWGIAPAQATGGTGGGAGTGPANGWDIVGRKAGELARTGGYYEDVYVKTPVGWRFKKRDFIPSTSGADPAPLAPPSIPADTTPIDTLAPLARPQTSSRRRSNRRSRQRTISRSHSWSPAMATRSTRAMARARTARLTQDCTPQTPRSRVPQGTTS